MIKSRQFIHSVTLLLLLICNWSIMAQTDSDTVKEDFSAYLEAIKSKDFETSLSYVVDEVFDIVPKETMLMVMEQTFNTEGVEFTFGDFVIDKINEPIVIDSTSYVIMNYTNDMSIRFTSEDEDDEASEEDKKMTRLLTQSALEQQFGKESVVYNETTDFYDIKAVKKAIAIGEENVGKWKFLVVEKGNPFILKSILPSSILEKVLTED